MNFKRFLILPLLALSANSFSAYFPVPGLEDPLPGFGPISATLLSNPAIPALQNERNCIDQFARQANMGRSYPYQVIMTAIKNSQSPLALQALEAYATTIMYIYHEKAYMIKSNNKPGLIKGIRYSWLSFSWLNLFSYFGDNDPALDQLLNEYEQLADIAHGKNPLIAKKMHLTVHSYRHWRKYIAGAILAYTIRDWKNNDAKDTIINRLLYSKPKQQVMMQKQEKPSFFANLFKKEAPARPATPEEDKVIVEMLKIKQLKEALEIGKHNEKKAEEYLKRVKHENKHIGQYINNEQENASDVFKKYKDSQKLSWKDWFKLQAMNNNASYDQYE